MPIEHESSVIVVGGGITGLTVALEIAEFGHHVHLVERLPYLGGRVAQSNRYFPKLCPPYCGLEINFRRIKQNPRIDHYTLSEVEKIDGSCGQYRVTVRSGPRFVNDRCTACGKCVDVCPVERPDDFNYGLSTTNAIYLPHDLAFPMRYVIDSQTCLGGACAKCVAVCPYGAIELDMPASIHHLAVGSIVWTTGWKPFDASQVGYYGFGRYPNVISNVMMERLAAINGPTGGRISKPSGEGDLQTVAFIQCAGSRDQNYLPYCSGVCCPASLKQALYVRKQYPEAKIYVFYIDIRTPGRLEDFYNRVKADGNIFLIKGKVAEVLEDPESKELVLRVEDVEKGQGMQVHADLVVLATGVVPSTADEKIPLNVTYDDDGFVADSRVDNGVIVAGCVRRPVDVAESARNATGAALKAIQSLRE